MQVQSVANAQTNFKSSLCADDATLVNMRNSDLKSLAYYLNNNSEENRKKQNSIIRTFCAIPIIDTLASGILAAKLIPKNTKLTKNEEVLLKDFEIKGASLAERTSIMGGKAAFWGAAIAGVIAYNKIKHAIFPGTYEQGGFTQKHPVLSFLTDVALIVGGFMLCGRGLTKGMEALDKNYPKFVGRVSKNIVDFMERLDKSVVNKKYLPRLEKSAVDFAHKHPGTSLLGLTGLVCSVPILFVVGLCKAISYDHHERQRVQENYLDLKKIQLQIARKMNRRYNDNHVILLTN